MKAKSSGECLPSSGQEPDTEGKLNTLLKEKGVSAGCQGKRNEEMNICAKDENYSR